jgi:hypothetical protein
MSPPAGRWISGHAGRRVGEERGDRCRQVFASGCSGGPEPLPLSGIEGDDRGKRAHAERAADGRIPIGVDRRADEAIGGREEIRMGDCRGQKLVAPGAPRGPKDQQQRESCVGGPAGSCGKSFHALHPIRSQCREIPGTGWRRQPLGDRRSPGRCAAARSLFVSQFAAPCRQHRPEQQRDQPAGKMRAGHGRASEKPRSLSRMAIRPLRACRAGVRGSQGRGNCFGPIDAAAASAGWARQTG